MPRLASLGLAALLAIPVACGNAPGLSPTPTPGATATPAIATPSSTAIADDVVRIPLAGETPIAVAISVDGETAWVVCAEGAGTLHRVELAAATEGPPVVIGPFGTHVVLTDVGSVFVARFDRSGVGEHLVSFDPTTGGVGGIATGALGGLAWGDGSLWALEKADRLLRIDPGTGEFIAEVSVDVDPNTHMEVAWGGGAAWVTSDALALRRISPDGAAIIATLETGGGIPFDADGGLIWGARPGEIWAVDPATNDVARRVSLDDTIEILDLDVEGDEAWLAVRRPGGIGKVRHMSLATGAVIDEFDVSLPAGIAIAPDRVWVTSYLTNELVGFRRG